MTGAGTAAAGTDTRRLGLLTGGTAVSRLADGSPALTELRRALAELGYVEGRNLVLERRDAEGRYDRLPALAAELVATGVDVLVAASNPDAEAAKEATRAIPVVFVAADPVGTGLVTNLERPGGNVTGLTLGSHSGARRLALLREVVPSLTRAAVLLNLAHASVPFQLRQTEAGAQSLGVSVQRFEVRDAVELSDAFMTIERVHPDGLVVLHHPLFAREARHLGEWASRSRLPMIAPYVKIAEAGALIGYEPDLLYPFRRAATYVDEILRGRAPGELPVEASTRFRLAVNLKAARTLGLRVPKGLLARADQIIE